MEWRQYIYTIKKNQIAHENFEIRHIKWCILPEYWSGECEYRTERTCGTALRKKGGRGHTIPYTSSFDKLRRYGK